MKLLNILLLSFLALCCLTYGKFLLIPLFYALFFYVILNSVSEKLIFYANNTIQIKLNELLSFIIIFLISLIFGFLTQSLLTNHVATGLALTIFGIGLSAMLGKNFVGIPGKEFPILFSSLKESIPFFGPILFGHSIVLYFAFALPFLTNYFLKKTKLGLVVRAVGDSPVSASNQGINVILVRYCCILYGGAMCGLAGAYLSLIYTPQWIENMTAGRGWIALALVVFATWSPIKVLIGALIFGGITILQLHMQAIGFRIPVQFLSALPYLMTIIVLVVISRDSRKIKLNTPTS